MKTKIDAKVKANRTNRENKTNGIKILYNISPVASSFKPPALRAVQYIFYS